MTPKPHPAKTATAAVHPLQLRHTYRLLSTLALGKRSNDEIEELANRLASARSLRELNQCIRPLRQARESIDRS